MLAYIRSLLPFNLLIVAPNLVDKQIYSLYNLYTIFICDIINLIYVKQITQFKSGEISQNI